MSLVLRTATIQARVFPPVKEASERVLSRIGLNMSEALELFLRRVIVDECIPFDIIALDARMLAEGGTLPAEKQAGKAVRTSSSDTKKNSKNFPGGSMSRRREGLNRARNA